MTKSRELLLKVGLLGMKDLRKLAPIGDIGYLNAISFYHDYERSGLISALMKAFYEQGFKSELVGYNHRGTDTHYYCKELEMHYHVDSSD